MFLQGTMWPEKFALAVAMVVFSDDSVALILQRYLPKKHTTAPAT
jgi:hypothetical protein